MDADVIVVGAGAAGLACARDLADGGADVLVVEARDRIGGRVHTLRGFGNELIEIGALVIHGEHAATIDIVRDAGLTLGPPRWTAPGETFLSVDGELRPAKELEGWWGLEHEVGRLGGPDVPLRRFLIDAGWPDLRRAFAEEVFAQIWAADPAILSAEGIARVERAWTSGYDNLKVREGYDRVMEFLARGLRVDLGRPASKVSWKRGRVDVDGLTASAAVVSVPPTVFTTMTFDPPLDPNKVEAATAIPLGPVIRVVAQLSEPAESTGSLISVGRVGGFWSVGRDLLTVWTAGPSAKRLSGAPPEEIALRARVAFPWLERDRIDDVVVADWGLEPFSLGAYSYPRVGALDAPAVLAEPVASTLFFCGEATCGDVHPATVHGAIESGRRAAVEVAAEHLR